MRLHALLVLVALGAFHCSAIASPTVPDASLDDKQKAIIAKITDEAIADIAALKAKYPELQHFGEAPYFTRGFGEFRYDYKMDASVKPVTPKPGGCAFYFRLHAWGGADSKWMDYYTGHSGFKGFGPAFAGIAEQSALAADKNSAGELSEEIQRVLRDNLETQFNGLASEYLLEKRGYKTDDASLLAELKDSAAIVNQEAITALELRKLNPGELAVIRECYISSAHPLSIIGPALSISEEQDGEHLPEICRDMVQLAFSLEKRGQDKFDETPSISMPWVSEARDFRRAILSIIQKRPDGERFANTELAILNEDAVSEYRLFALDYFAKLNGSLGRKSVVEAMDNSNRRVQAKAAKMVGKRKWKEGRKQLLQLLVSPSSKVRKSARDALAALGEPLPARKPARILPESIVTLANVMWQKGLTQKDVINVCSRPEKELRFYSSGSPPPLKSAFPDDVDFKENTRIHNTQQDGSVTSERNWSATLGAWRMSTLDDASIRKRTAEYAVGFGTGIGFPEFDLTGPFLLAAAVRADDLKSAERVYETMCDIYDTDDSLRDWSVTGIGWLRFQQGVDDFQRKKDNEALECLRGVAALEDYAKPSSFLRACVDQSKKMIPEIEARLKTPPSPVPDKSDQDAYIRYWVGRIKDINGAMCPDGGAAEPAIWYEYPTYSDFPEPPFASDKLREVGLATLPYLMDVIDDETATRTLFTTEQFGSPNFNVITTVGEAARQIFVVICCDYGLTPPDFLKSRKGLEPNGAINPADACHPLDHSAKLKLFKEWAATIPQGVSPLPEKERTAFRWEHASSAFWWVN